MLQTILLVSVVSVTLSHADNRALMCDMAVDKLGLTFYKSAELLTIAKCVDPQFFATPNNSTVLVAKLKTCVLNNSGNKALQALSLYTNVNNCLNPETLDDVVTKLIPPVAALADAFVTKIKSTLADCKKSNTQAAATKQETCLQKCYGVGLVDLTANYVDNICKKIVNQNVDKQEWGCGQKYIPAVITFTKYTCSNIVKS